jgi:hypothetical protein
MQTFAITHAPENDSAKVFQAMSPVAAVPESASAATHQHTLQRTPGCACGGGCPRCESEIAAKSNGAAHASSFDSAASLVSDALSAPGEPLDQTVRNNFESRFQQDFSDVRVHRDERASQSAQAVNAHAYTVGRDIVFSAGQYKPETGAGNRLIAHELTHVLQQRGAGNQPARHGAMAGSLTRHSNEQAHSLTRTETNRSSTSSLRVSNPSDASEQEADRVAQAVTENVGAAHTALPSVKHATDSGLLVQRDKADAAHAAPPAAAATDADVLNWPQILPANSIEHLSIKKNDPTRYAMMTAICAKIKEFRKTIPIKAMKSNKYTVFDQSPQPTPALPTPNFDDTTTQGKDYRKWLKGAQTPEEQDKEYNHLKVEDDDELRIQLVLWHELMGDEKTPGEGDPSAMNAYDSEGITWGAGFSGKGPMQEMMYKHLFQRERQDGPNSDNRAVEETFLRAGINVTKGDGSTFKFVVVDVNGLWQMPQSEGVKVIKADKHLLSIFTDVAQGGDFMQSEEDREVWKSDLGQYILAHDPQMPYKGARQAVYNAQWEQFKSRAGNIKSVVPQLKGWNPNSLAFAGHIMHWGITGLTWSDFASSGGSAAALRNLVLPKLATNNLVQADAAASFMRFGNGLMQSVMAAGSAPVAGKINVMVGKDKYYSPA